MHVHGNGLGEGAQFDGKFGEGAEDDLVGEGLKLGEIH